MPTKRGTVRGACSGALVVVVVEVVDELPTSELVVVVDGFVPFDTAKVTVEPVGTEVGFTELLYRISAT
jgi:hypothetical protein